MRATAVFLIVMGFAIVTFASARGAEQPKTASRIQNGPVCFLRDVMPLVNHLGCNQAQCHGSDQGKGGLAFSLFGADPQQDYEALVKLDGGRRLNRIEPAKSLLLLKLAGAVAHGGGQKVPSGSPEYKTILSWAAQGAPYSDEKLPSLASVKVLPAERVLQKGESGQVSVTAVFSDGTQSDVTHMAAFRSTEPEVASVDAAGKIKAEGFGQAAVVATYMRRTAVAPIIVPQPLPSPFPAVQPNNKIDELVFAHLKTLGIPPSEVCTDEVFLRRVFLDAIGTLPTPEEVRAFRGDADPQKRVKLIDRLLERPEFADFWALKWSDLLRVKAEDPVNLWPKGAEVYYRFIRESIAANKPYDQFVRELITSSGSGFRVGPANFFRAVDSRDARTYGETAAVLFMGTRMACARCHGHPVENWGKDDDLGLAAFFGQMSVKTTNEWKEDIVYRDLQKQLRHPQTAEVVKPKFLGGAAVELDKEADPRQTFARWLTAPENLWFAKNAVNRVWFWLLGRGIVHEADDLRSTNPPENPALLEYLAKELIGQHYDLKHIYRLVLGSKTYQLSSRVSPLNEKDAAHFSHYRAKRLTAEEAYDALLQVTDSAARKNWTLVFERHTPSPITVLPWDCRAVQLADGSAACGALGLFGRPPRATPYERERGAAVTLPQVRFFLNSGEVEQALRESQRLKGLVEAKKSDGEAVEEFFLAALSRPPSPHEKQKAVQYIAQCKRGRPQGIGDVVWALLNTVEFLFNH